MATVRAGRQTALVVVDVQVGVVADVWQAPRAIANVALAVARAREQGVPVVWVQHHSRDLPQGSPPWQWVPELVPADGEPLVHKQFNSGFEQTTLEAELAQRSVAHIVLAGAQTSWCIRATAYGALERGYDLTLLKDAHTTETLVMDDGTRVEAEQAVHDLNIAMTWLRYPGRRNAVAEAATVDFSGKGG